MKKINLAPEVPAQIRAIPQHVALNILHAIHRYADTGAGRVKPLSGEFEGFLRLRVGDSRAFFKETDDAVTVHRVADRRDVTPSPAAKGGFFWPFRILLGNLLILRASALETLTEPAIASARSSR